MRFDIHISLVALLFLCATALGEPFRHIIQPTMLDNKSYTEIYTMITENDNGTFIQVQFTFTNLGIHNKNAACKVLVLNPSQKPWKVNEKFNQKQWSYVDKPNPLLSIGVNTLTVLHDKVNLEATVGDIQLTVSLIGSASLIKPPNADSPKNTSGKFYDFEILVPWTNMTGTLTLPDGLKQNIHGYGLLERARSVGTSRDICRGWVTFRGHEGQFFFMVNFRLPPQKKAAVLGWIWETGDTKPVVAKGVIIKKGSSIINGKVTETQIISVTDPSFTIIGNKNMYRYSFVDELGTFTGYIVKNIVGKPVTTYYDASIQFKNGRPIMRGVLELMNVE
jgi:hypothetical protein